MLLLLVLMLMLHACHMTSLNNVKSQPCELRIICHFLLSSPRKLLLTELRLLPSQVFYWRQILQFWNGLAVNRNVPPRPVGSLCLLVLSVATVARGV